MDGLWDPPMDGLWDPPNYQASEDTNSISLAYDVLEETAVNEKSCIQVLQILISKADTDIIELEEELTDLLSQLACTDEVFSDMLCMSLRVKIDFLDLSIRKLKDDAGGFLSTGREPVENIHDILKSLFCRYLQKKDLQFSDNARNIPSTHFQVCAKYPSEQKRQTGSCSNANHIGKSTRAVMTPVEKLTVSKIRVKIEEENKNYPTSALGLCWGSTKKMDREVNKFQVKSPRMTKGIIPSKTPRYNSICQKPSLEIQGKWKHQLKLIKSQTDDGSIDSTPLPMIEAPSAKQNISRELVFPPGYPNPQDHQEQSVLLSVSRYPTRAYKRQQKPNSPMCTRSTSACLLEGPKPVNNLAIVVADPLNISETYSSLSMDYYTLTELRVVGKERKIKGYYKLRKSELAEVLGIKCIEGRRKQKRKETLLVPKIQFEP